MSLLRMKGLFSDQTKIIWFSTGNQMNIKIKILLQLNSIDIEKHKLFNGLLVVFSTELQSHILGVGMLVVKFSQLLA